MALSRSLSVETTKVVWLGINGSRVPVERRPKPLAVRPYLRNIYKLIQIVTKFSRMVNEFSYPLFCRKCACGRPRLRWQRTIGAKPGGVPGTQLASSAGYTENTRDAVRG